MSHSLASGKPRERGEYERRAEPLQASEVSFGGQTGKAGRGGHMNGYSFRPIARSDFAMRSGAGSGSPGSTRIATGLFEPDNPADHRKHYIYRTARP